MVPLSSTMRQTAFLRLYVQWQSTHKFFALSSESVCHLQQITAELHLVYISLLQLHATRIHPRVRKDILAPTQTTLMLNTFTVPVSYRYLVLLMSKTVKRVAAIASGQCLSPVLLFYTGTNLLYTPQDKVSWSFSSLWCKPMYHWIHMHIFRNPTLTRKLLYLHR